MYGPWARNHPRARSVLIKNSQSSPQCPGQGITPDHVAAVLTINQTYNNLGLYDSVADSQILLLNNQSIVQLEVHLLGIKVSHNILISSTQTLAAKTDFLCGRPQVRPRGERG